MQAKPVAQISHPPGPAVVMPSAWRPCDASARQAADKVRCADCLDKLRSVLCALRPQRTA